MTTKIHEDGIYFNLPMNDYLDDPALGSSDIKNLLISPLQYWAKSHLNPDRPPRKDTDATKFGTLLHEAILEPGKNSFVTKPEGMSFACKDGKAWKEDMIAMGATIVTPDQGRTMAMMMKAVELSGLKEALEDSFPEVSYFWTSDTGHRCKIRTDALKTNCGFDLKTYQNSMGKDIETAIAHAVAQYRYHISAEWYRIGLDHMRAKIASEGAGIIQMAQDKIVERAKLLIHNMQTDGLYPYWYCFLEKDGVPNVTIRQFGRNIRGDTTINEYWRAARNAIQHATSIYATNCKIFDGEPWIEEAPMKTFSDQDFAAARWIFD